MSPFHLHSHTAGDGAEVLRRLTQQAALCPRGTRGFSAGAGPIPTQISPLEKTTQRSGMHIRGGQ